ncbi:uncharacterized protein LOC120336574 [Styela clava]
MQANRFHALKICQSSTHVTNNCSYDADDRVWLSASLQSYDFQDSRMEYFVILKTSLPQQASNKTDFKFFLITVLINNVVCQRCYSSVPTSISVHLQSSEMIPSCYNGCALSVHQSGIKEFVLDQNRRFILITKIGQVIHCLNGKVKDVCDIPNIGQCGISCCQWEDILLVLHDRDSKTAFIINFKKFKIVKTASNISYVIIGDFLQSGQSQILLIKEKFEFGQESDDFVLLKSYSDLRCTSSPTSSGTNSIVMYEESDDALSSNADIFSGPMETETASESFDSCIKSRVCTALQHNIMGQVALLQERKDTLLYKSTSFSQLLKLIVRLSNNTDKCLDDFKEVVPALVDLTPANNVKEVTEFCSNMECNGLSILQLFQRFLNDNVHVCAMIKNTTARNISQLAMHICGGFESSQFQIDTLNVAIIYEPSYFESPNPCSAFQSKTCVLPNEIVWVTGRFKICSKLLSRVMRGTAFLVKLSYVIRNCDTDRVVMSKIGELPFHHTLNDSKEINSIFTSTESKLVESAINFLNCIHVCKFKHRVYTKCHSVKILDDVLSNNLCFITFNKKNIWICKERGPLFLVRIVLTYQSETSTYMEIQCENKEQNDRLLFALNTYLPADFLFEHEL